MNSFYQSALYQNCFSLPSTIIKTVKRNFLGQKFEPEVKVLGQLIKSGGVCIDVGGAYGRYALPLSRIVGPQGKIFSFEPGSYSWKVLKFIKLFFGLDNVVIIKKAVSDRAGSIELCVPSKKSGKLGASLAHIRASPQADSFCETVDMLTLDGFVKQEGLSRLDLIKCDTEGAELLVFQGAATVIERFKPIVLTEIDANNLARFGQKPSDILDFFRARNYRLMVWNASALVPALCADEPGNYFFIPEPIKI
jgi:FkbM family methyltransferase